MQMLNDELADQEALRERERERERELRNTVEEEKRRTEESL